MLKSSNMLNTSNSKEEKKSKKWIIHVIVILLLAGIGTTIFFVVKKDNPNSSTEVTTNTDTASNTDVASNTDITTEQSTELTTEEENTTEEEKTTEVETSESQTTESNTTESSSQPTTQAPATTEAQTTEATHVCSFSVVETVPATCTTDGYTKKACSCGQTTLTTEPATGHNFVTTSTTVHHDEVGEYIWYAIFSNGYKMKYTTDDAICQYQNDYFDETGVMLSFYMSEEWTVIQEAYDEVITTTTCSHCGCPQ